MPMTSNAGGLGLTLPGASWVGCFLLPLLGRELGCWSTYWPEKPRIPFLGPADERGLGPHRLFPLPSLPIGWCGMSWSCFPRKQWSLQAGSGRESARDWVLALSLLVGY